MAILRNGVPLPEVRTGHNCLIVDVSWKAADGLQTYLRRKGVSSTLCLEPGLQEARLEIWPGLDEAYVREAIASHLRKS